MQPCDDAAVRAGTAALLAALGVLALGLAGSRRFVLPLLSRLVSRRGYVAVRAGASEVSLAAPKVYSMDMDDEDMDDGQSRPARPFTFEPFTVEPLDEAAEEALDEAGWTTRSSSPETVVVERVAACAPAVSVAPADETYMAAGGDAVLRAGSVPHPPPQDSPPAAGALPACCGLPAQLAAHEPAHGSVDASEPPYGFVSPPPGVACRPPGPLLGQSDCPLPAASAAMPAASLAPPVQPCPPSPRLQCDAPRVSAAAPLPAGPRGVDDGYGAAVARRPHGAVRLDDAGTAQVHRF